VLTVLNDNMLMELILLELMLGSVCFALLIACIRVVSSDPSEEKPADPEK
jgi:hypothetical protein